MTKIVGIDFGTSNVRITQWDADSGENPSSCAIGEGSSSVTMPAVIAFEKQTDGKVVTTFGEEADGLGDSTSDVKVIRNIKRWALTTDGHVRQQLAWHLERQAGGNEQPLPEWLALNPPSIRLWNETMTAADAIKEILKKAISRSDLAGSVAEWRAGCPVDSDLAYREALVSALEDLGCTGRIEWITEEPLLLLALGKESGVLVDGHYLVYDLGGGSFDCAIVKVRGDQLAVLSNEGLPLGGTDIDDRLMERLDYDISRQILRIAKEQLYSDDPPAEIDLGRGHTLSRQDIDDTLEVDGFIDNFVNETLRTAVNTYKKAQLFIDEGSSQEGWQASINSMKDVIDRVLVVGGPTRMPYFTDKLGATFGTEKVMTADELIRTADRADIVDPTLTALSHGACHMRGEGYTALTVDRIPAKITLKVSDGSLVEEDSYEPFTKLPTYGLLTPYVGRMIVRRDPYDRLATILDPTMDSTYSVLVTDAEGDILYESDSSEMRMSRDGYTGPRADRIRLVVDRLGGVKVVLGAGYTHVPSPLEDTVEVIANPQWQLELRTEADSRTLAHELLEEGQKRLAESQSPNAPISAHDTSVVAAYGEKRRRA